MSPDRRLFGLGRPEHLEEKGFTATATGADLVYRWLALKQSAAGNEMLQAPNTAEDVLDLGQLIIEDSTLRAVASSVSYDKDDLEYELRSGFVLTDSDASSSDPFDRLSFLDTDKQRRERDRISGSLRRILERKLKSQGLSIEDDHDTLVIKNTDPEFHDEFQFHPVERSRFGDIFCFHCKQEVDHESEDVFNQRYQVFAQLSAQVGNAFYEMHGLTPPSKVLEIKPPKSFETRLGFAEGAVKQRRKILSASGMIDGDEEIAREIQEKVQLISMPTETFDDIGGNEKAKEELQTIVHALKDPQAYKRWGTSAPKGLLLFGEPGTGKTMLTKALAHEAGVGIYVVELADVLHSLYGRTERLLNEVFNQARKNAPVVILIDELDALAGNRRESSEITSRVVTVLLSNLDGLSERPEGIVVVGTTNRVEAIDPALKRPGRLDMLIEVPMPDDNQRAQIFTLKMNKARQIATKAGGNKIFGSIDFVQLIKITKGFSGADIEEVVRRALARKVREENKGQKPNPVTTNDIVSVIETYETVRKARKIGFSASA